MNNENEKEIMFKIVAVDGQNKVQEVYKRYFNTMQTEKPYNTKWRYLLLDPFQKIKIGDSIETYGCEKYLGGDW